jgi:putative polyhydroxyalkanoate system protein
MRKKQECGKKYPMSTVRRSRKHSLSMSAARASAEEIAKELSSRYGISYRWQDNQINFRGAGAKGVLWVHETRMEIEIELSLLLRPARGKIEAAVDRYMDRYCV